MFGLSRPQHLQTPWACVYGNGDGEPFFLQVAENPCWDWYTEQVTQIKTPNDAFNYIVQLANGGWQFQHHVENSGSYSTQQRQSVIHGHTSRGERRGNKGTIADTAHCSKQDVDHEQAQPAA